MTRPALPAQPEPAGVAADLARLRGALDDTIPAKSAKNLLIGTWNLRAFGNLTQKWQSATEDTPKRDWHALACIAAVVDRFDICAIQETRRDTTALQAMLRRLGPRYRVIASDVTEGDAGNDERLAYVYDTKRVQPSGLVGEIVLPPEVNGSGPRQFARTPYAAGFVRRRTEFILTTVHVLWGRSPKDRIDELAAFASWMGDWARRPRDWNQNLLVLGDFNIDRLDDPLFRAFASTGLWPPAELNNVRRTVFAHNGKENHFYDQIAWFSDPTKPDNPPLLTGLRYAGRGGGFDFVPHVLRNLTTSQLSWRISDHYPLWLEFTT